MSGDVVSDDFSGATLDAAWSVAEPAGSSVHLATTATDAILELVTPDGSFDAWNGSNTLARAMQSVADTDFQLEARFLSRPTQQYQGQGFFVEQDAQNWIRLETYHDGSRLKAFGAVTVDGVSTQKFKVNVAADDAPYLRVTRSGDTWTLEWSRDGASWTSRSFTHDLTVTKVGLAAGNSGAAQGFTARVDWFENTASPITDEDGTIVPVNAPPVAGDDALATDQGAALAIPISTLLANDSDANGDALSLAGFTQPTHGTLTNANGVLTYTPDAGYVGSDSFGYTVSDGSLSDNGTVTIAVGNPIDVWYGLEQSFGSPGEAQRWINILGNVAGEVTRLEYSLNGGPLQRLSIGADERRLQDDGDFNVDIDYAALNGTSVDDIVTIRATMSSGQVYTRQVVVDYESGHAWSKNYSIDWGSVGDIQDAVQIVDGTWTKSGGGVRPVDLGYDRLLALGDHSWDNYELRLSVTMNELTNTDPDSDEAGGFAIGMLWTGHTDTPFPGRQPKVGWEPGAAFFYVDENDDGVGVFTLHPSRDFFDVISSRPFALEEDTTYNFAVRVEQVDLYDRLYSLKVWEAGTAEPTGWTLQGVQTFSTNAAPETGSVYLNAHYFDVTFNDLAVTELPGRDIVQGTGGANVLAAVTGGDPTPGRGEIDVLAGYGGADVFVLGNSSGAYYDDGVGTTAGTGDYAFLWDFTPGTDSIRLAGEASDYTTALNMAGLPSGTAILRDVPGDDTPELIAILNGVSSVNLNGGDFIYVGDGLIA